MTMARRITEKLMRAFAPTALAVEDQSEQHRGHGGWREGGETHFRVAIVSAAFEGLTPVSRHRLVNEALRDEFAAGLHALSIDAHPPGRGR
jgi:BolA protein